MENNKKVLCYHEDTELRLGLPGRNEVDKQSTTSRANKRGFSSIINDENTPSGTRKCHDDVAPPTKAQAIGWPPVKSYRKNCLQATKLQEETSTSIYVKVSMDGAPYLRKIDLRLYKSYKEFLKALEGMFKVKDREYEPTYEDKDGDWMLVGDVPWEMFIGSCKRLRIMKGLDCLA